MARVVIENLTKVFQGPGGVAVGAVQGVSLAVEEREFLVLVGPSGCGKTTILRLIAGLEEPTQGTVAIDGRVLNAVAPKDREVAMVFQHHALYPHLSVYENLAFGLKLRKCPRPEIQRQVQAAAAALDLTACLERRPQELSGGQRQRVALGRALVRRPKVFLFDEPLSNLDAPLRAQMRAEIARLHTRLGATAIYVTHDQVEAMVLGHRIAVMNAGVIQQVAEPLGLYRHPANLFVAGFIGSPPMNFFQGTLVQKGNALFFQEQSPHSAAAPAGLALRLEDSLAARMRDCPGRKVILGIRPEHIADRLSVPDAPPEQTVEAVVEVVQPMGSETYLHLAGGAQPFVARLPATDCLHAGQRIVLAFAMRHAQLFDPATGEAVR
jgi:multiple sugar transport system ATP-binding protein